MNGVLPCPATGSGLTVPLDPSPACQMLRWVGTAHTDGSNGHQSLRACSWLQGLKAHPLLPACHMSRCNSNCRTISCGIGKKPSKGKGKPHVPFCEETPNTTDNYPSSTHTRSFLLSNLQHAHDHEVDTAPRLVLPHVCCQCIPIEQATMLSFCQETL